MKKRYLPLLLLLPALGRAQAPAACGCAQNFAETRHLLETNYAGYRDKVTAATRPRLDSLTAALQPQADTARAGSCWQVLQQYLRFFRDGHVQLANNKPPRLNADSIRARYAGAARLPWTRASFRAYLDDATRPKQPLEGIWLDGSGGGYVVGIVANGAAGYQGFILKADSTFWLPGQVKFSFSAPAAGPATATYAMRNHSLEIRPVRVVRDGELDINGPWYRRYPRPVAAPAVPAPLSFRMLNDTTALYRIASFDGSLRPKIDSLTKANAAHLARTRLLILDVRGNGGGSDGSYRSLLPYLATGPVQTVHVALYSTPENNRKYARAMYPQMSLGEKLYYRYLRYHLDRHPGELVPLLGGPVTTRQLPRRRQHPEVARVAVLQDNGCASTTEQFLLAARQSSKVITFGGSSAGVLDYANMQFKPLPCYNLRLGWATSRSFRLDRGQGIDHVGLAPSVRLDPAAPDLVEQVRTWYRARH